SGFCHVLRANEGGASGLGQSSESAMSSWCEAVPASCGGPALADETAHVSRIVLRELLLLLEELLARNSDAHNRSTIIDPCYHSPEALLQSRSPHLLLRSCRRQETRL